MAGDITVEELARWRETGKPFVLLDVRKFDEVARAALPGAVHMPMRDVPTRAGEIDQQAEVAVLCHHGGRSERVAHFLQTRGFARVHNVSGGIDAYARRVDPSVPTY